MLEDKKGRDFWPKKQNQTKHIGQNNNSLAHSHSYGLWGIFWSKVAGDFLIWPSDDFSDTGSGWFLYQGPRGMSGHGRLGKCQNGQQVFFYMLLLVGLAFIYSMWGLPNTHTKTKTNVISAKWMRCAKTWEFAPGDVCQICPVGERAMGKRRTDWDCAALCVHGCVQRAAFTLVFVRGNHGVDNGVG